MHHFFDLFLMPVWLHFGSMLGSMLHQKTFLGWKRRFVKMSVSCTRELHFRGSGPPKFIQKASQNALKKQSFLKMVVEWPKAVKSAEASGLWRVDVRCVKQVTKPSIPLSQGEGLPSPFPSSGSVSWSPFGAAGAPYRSIQLRGFTFGSSQGFRVDQNTVLIHQHVVLVDQNDLLVMGKHLIDFLTSFRDFAELSFFLVPPRITFCALSFWIFHII